MVKLSIVDNIEVSSICDNQCPYCLAPLQAKHRPVGFMAMETFMKAMKWVDYCVAKGTQSQLNLYGVGEATLNPNIVEMARIARQHLPPDVALHMNTNGNTMTEELAKGLKSAGVSHIDVTGHKPREAARAIKILKKYGLFGIVSIDFMLNPNNWAGQVEWFEPDYQYPCPWTHRGQVMVMWDGRIARCCLDAFATGIICTLDDSPADCDITPFELCKHCHQVPPGDPRLAKGSSLIQFPDGMPGALKDADDKIKNEWSYAYKHY